MLGLDAEGGSKSISLVQISTARPCLLLRMPPYEEQKKKGVGFSASFRRMMTDRSILKGGAELWNDVLEIWGSCQRLATNGCVNVTLLHRDENGESDSLEDVCEKVVEHDSFRKDRQTTCSAWDAPALTLRQMVYAAVDAQTSYMLAARTPSLPPLLHLAMSSLSGAANGVVPTVVMRLDPELDGMLHSLTCCVTLLPTLATRPAAERGWGITVIS